MEDSISYQGVILGGAITLVAGVIVFALEKWWEISVSAKQKLELQSAEAFSAQAKLMEIYTWYRTLNNALDECFKSIPDPQIPPAVKVLPLVGSRTLVQEISPAELSLALKSGDSGLTENMIRLQGCYQSDFELVEEFNQQRNAFSSFVMECAVGGDFTGGVEAVTAIPVEHKYQHEARISTLNSIVGSLVDNVSDGEVLSKETLLRFNTAVNSLNGIVIPSVKVKE